MLQLFRLLMKTPFSYWKAILACPGNEPLHFHHDGCPVCSPFPNFAVIQERSRIRKIREGRES